MAIEHIMYFTLGLLTAGLLAVLIIPSVWNRAVRLTKKRIESTIPITLAEFRAEKDQLRAEFALESRRLERANETLRSRLTEQLSALNAAQTDMAIAKAERNRSLAVQSELEDRLDAANERIRDLEKEAADLAQRLRGRTREIEELAALAIPQHAGDKPRSTSGAISAIRRALSFGERDTFEALSGIDEAFTRISSAGSSLEALLDNQDPENEDAEKPASLAQRLSEEDAMAQLHEKIINVENTIKVGFDTDTTRAALREELDNIAAAVTGIVYNGEDTEDPDETLFERIRRFAGSDFEDEEKSSEPARPVLGAQRTHEPSLSDRLAAFANFNN